MKTGDILVVSYNFCVRHNYCDCHMSKVNFSCGEVIVVLAHRLYDLTALSSFGRVLDTFIENVQRVS